MNNMTTTATMLYDIRKANRVNPYSIRRIFFLFSFYCIYMQKWILAEPTVAITTNKASGGDGIPVEIFQILKDDAVKMLLSICQKI